MWNLHIVLWCWWCRSCFQYVSWTTIVFLLEQYLCVIIIIIFFGCVLTPGTCYMTTFVTYTKCPKYPFAEKGNFLRFFPNNHTNMITIHNNRWATHTASSPKRNMRDQRKAVWSFFLRLFFSISCQKRHFLSNFLGQEKTCVAQGADLFPLYYYTVSI